jgi:outer membrane protein TolC
MVLALGAVTVLDGCSLAPRYETPATTPAPAAYKEVGDWKPAEPADSQVRGDWWTIYGDSELNTLEGQVTESN